MVLLSRGLLDVGADALGTFPVVVVQGARQVGKSTLAAMLVQGREARQVTLDDLAVRGRPRRIRWGSSSSSQMALW